MSEIPSYDFDGWGCPAEIVNYVLSRTQPPYIFGFIGSQPIGHHFRLGKQDFVIKRISSREEYFQRRMTPVLSLPDDVMYFYEVKTRITMSS